MSNPTADVVDPGPPGWLHVGARVLDTDSDRTGVVMSVGLRMGGQRVGPAGRVWLRPPGGGVEWETDVRHLAPGATDVPTADEPAHASGGELSRS